MNAHRAVKYFASAILVCAAGLCAVVVAAEEKPYVEGTVWNVSLIRVKPGMFDVYMNEVLPLRKKINEGSEKTGFPDFQPYPDRKRIGQRRLGPRRS